MAKILIVGAGDVGGRVACALAADGHEVHALSRRPLSRAGVRMLAADVTRPETLLLPADLDLVMVALSPGEPGEPAYRRVYLEGTRHILAALAGRLPRHLFWVSSTSVYGEQAGEVVDVLTPPRPATATACVLLESEQLAASTAVPCTVVRCSGLYGPGRHRLLHWVETGRPVQVEPLNWTNRLHVADAAGLLAHLCRQALAGIALPGVVLASDDCPVPQHEVLDWLAASMGLPAPPRLPAGGASGRRIANTLHSVGYVLRYPDYRSGYAEVLLRRS